MNDCGTPHWKRLQERHLGFPQELSNNQYGKRSTRCRSFTRRNSTMWSPHSCSPRKFLKIIWRVICAIFTDRQNPESTEFAYNEIERRVNDPKWPQMLLWPEGTTHNRISCPRHKLGAYKPGLPVQPLVLRFPNRWETDIWTFKGPGVPALWFYSLMQFWVNIEIEYLEPYSDGINHFRLAYAFC